MKDLSIKQALRDAIVEATETRWQQQLNTIPEVAAVDAGGTDGDALDYTFHQVYKAIQKQREIIDALLGIHPQGEVFRNNLEALVEDWNELKEMQQ